MPLPGSSIDERTGASLVIPTRNRPEMLTETVESVLQGTQIPQELIIVDQSDKPHEVFSDVRPMWPWRLRYLWPQPPGVSRGRNRGVKEATYQMVVLADDDILVEPDWLEALLGGLAEQGEHGVATGRVLPHRVHETGGFAPSTKSEETPSVYKGRPGKDVLYSANMAIYRSTFGQVGGFDPRLGPGTRFPAAEDNDLGFRLLERGHSIAYLPGAIIYHRAWRSRRDYLPLRWGYGVGRGAFYAKHMSIRDRYIASRMSSDVKNHLLSAGALMHDDPLRAHGDMVLALGIVWGALLWWATRRRSRGPWA